MSKRRINLGFQLLLCKTNYCTATCHSLGYHKNAFLCPPQRYYFMERSKTAYHLVGRSILVLAQTQAKYSYSVVESVNHKNVLIEYKPPQNYFRSGQDLFFIGGYNGWNGVDKPLILPLRQKVGKEYCTSDCL
jgi:hypothetical protein